MADIGQVLATGGTALVSAAAGAGLTYWFGALSRRHQEAREDRTRWYEARFRAYADLGGTATTILQAGTTDEEHLLAVARAASSVELVGSESAVNACLTLLVALPFADEGDEPWDENAVLQRPGTLQQRCTGRPWTATHPSLSSLSRVRQSPT